MWPAEICSVFINLEAQLLGPKLKPALHYMFSIQTFLTSTASSACLCMHTQYEELSNHHFVFFFVYFSCLLRLLLVPLYEITIQS